MSNDVSNAKIQMLKGSLRCFVCGLLGLLPVIGLPFAIAALWFSGQVRAQEKLFWNAATHYRIWGEVCAALGTVVWSIVDTLLIYQAFSNYASS